MKDFNTVVMAIFSTLIIAGISAGLMYEIVVSYERQLNKYPACLTANAPWYCVKCQIKAEEMSK